jgi:penicillin-binding protein 2
MRALPLVGTDARQHQRRRSAEVSCNYFFYEAGRLTGIEALDKYAKQFGLSQQTGIEIPESLGTLAGPEFSEKAAVQWYPGNTLAAAIGQSDNAFTPFSLPITSRRS